MCQSEIKLSKNIFSYLQLLYDILFRRPISFFTKKGKDFRFHLIIISDKIMYISLFYMD